MKIDGIDYIKKADIASELSKQFEDGYQRGTEFGAEKFRECITKICSMDDAELISLFCKQFTAQEIINKLEDHEEEQDEIRIRIGDEVERNGSRYWVLSVQKDYCDLWSSKCGETNVVLNKSLTRTGRHCDKLEETLNELHEMSDLYF